MSLFLIHITDIITNGITLPPNLNKYLETILHVCPNKSENNLDAKETTSALHNASLFAKTRIPDFSIGVCIYTV